MAKKVTKTKIVSGVNAALLTQQQAESSSEGVQPEQTKSSELPASTRHHDRSATLDIDAILAEAEAEAQEDELRVQEELSAPEKAEVVREALKDKSSNGESRISFSYQGEVYDCELVEIVPDRILDDTEVADENEREQKWLTKYTLRALIAKIKNTGQIYPALAFRDKVGKIWVVDGSRRRMSCFYAGKPYLVYVCDRELPPELVALLSEDTNEYKPPSLVERGRKWDKEMTDLRKEEPKLSLLQFAKRKGLNKDMVSAGIRGAHLPEYLLDHFPSPPDIGRTSIVALDRIHQNLTETHVQTLVKTLNDDALRTQQLTANIAPELDALSANHLFLNNLKEYIASLDEAGEQLTDDVTTFSDGCTLKVTPTGLLSVSMRKPEKENVLKLIAELKRRYDINE